MTRTTLQVLSPEGLNHHAAVYFVKRANEFPCRIMLSGKEERLNAKSLLSVVAMGIGPGEVITLTADGPEEEQAIAVLTEYLKHA